MANPDERNNTRKYLKYAVRAATAAEKPRAKSGRMLRRNAATVRTEPDSPHRTAGRRGIGSFAPIGPLTGRMSSRLAVAIRACDPHRTGKDIAGRYPIPPTTACQPRSPSNRLQQVIPGTRIAANHSSEPPLTDPSGTGKVPAAGPSSPLHAPERSLPGVPAQRPAPLRRFHPPRPHPQLQPPRDRSGREGTKRARTSVRALSAYGVFELFIRGRPLFAVQIPHQPAPEIPRDYNLLVRSFTSSPSNRCSTRWA